MLVARLGTSRLKRGKQVAGFLAGMFSASGSFFFQLVSGMVPSANGTVKGALVPQVGRDYARAAMQPLPWNKFPVTMSGLQKLCDSMTRKDRTERPRALQALEHRWFSSESDGHMPPTSLKGLITTASAHHNMDHIAQKLATGNNLHDLRVLHKKLQTADTASRGRADAHTCARILQEHGLDEEDNLVHECANNSSDGALHTMRCWLTRLQ